MNEPIMFNDSPLQKYSVAKAANVRRQLEN